MAETSPPQAQEVSAPPGRMRSPGTRKEDWIAKQLRQVYDDALQDAIPQTMIDLLDALDEGDDSTDTADGKPK